MRYAEYAIQLHVPDIGIRFFHRFARRALHIAFIVFHETRRQRPQPVARFDRTLAQQNPALPFGNTAGHHFWVLVVHQAAARADIALSVIARGNFPVHPRATKRAVIHRHRPHLTAVAVIVHWLTRVQTHAGQLTNHTCFLVQKRNMMVA